MKTWSFFDQETGEISAQTLSATNDEPASLNIPEGMVLIEGRYDHLSQRVDLRTGEVLDFQPESPGADHEWNSTSKRWQLTDAAFNAQAADAAARREIAAQEGRQARALRELALNPNDADARRHLLDIGNAIAAARMQLRQ